MQRRMALAAALLLLPVSVTTASSSPRCPLIADDRGDSSAHPVLQSPPVGGDASLDLVSADLATTPDALIGTIRLDRLEPSRVGLAYSFSFVVEDRAYVLKAVRAADGDNFSAYGPGDASRGGAVGSLPYLGEITGSINTSTSQVRLVVARSLLHAPAQGALLTSISVDSARFLGTGGRVRGSDTTEYGTTGNSHPADEARAGRSYAVGEPAC